MCLLCTFSKEHLYYTIYVLQKVGWLVETSGSVSVLGSGSMEETTELRVLKSLTDPKRLEQCEFMIN